MCRTVADVAAVMDVIAGVDPADPITAHAGRFSRGAFGRSLDRDSLRGVRVGVLRSLFEPDDTDPEVLGLMEAALNELANLGAVLVDLEIPDLGAGQDALWCDTFRHDANQYLATLGDRAPLRDVAEMVELGLYLPYLDERLKAAAAVDVPPERQDPPCLSVDADPRRQAWRDKIVAHMESASVAVMVFPTWAYPARRIGDFETPHGNNSYQIAPHTGFPAITVPAGQTAAGLPVGLQFLGRRFSDAEIVSYAYAFEQRTRHRRAPAFPPADLDTGAGDAACAH
jgi:Asp-tRNA(Asn)/Glu-tRNA(Gln) amidotransferase A subunit family amidase